MLVHGNAEEGEENLAESFEISGTAVWKGPELWRGSGSIVAPKRFGSDGNVVVLAKS